MTTPQLRDARSRHIRAWKQLTLSPAEQDESFSAWQDWSIEHELTFRDPYREPQDYRRLNSWSLHEDSRLLDIWHTANTRDIPLHVRERNVVAALCAWLEAHGDAVDRFTSQSV